MDTYTIRVYPKHTAVALAYQSKAAGQSVVGVLRSDDEPEKKLL